MGVITVGVHEAKTNLSKLLRRVASGEEVVITRGGTPVARMVPAGATGEQRSLGADAGVVTVADDFDAPLPSSLLDHFEP